jgi:endoribonuclease Dicer
MNSHLTRYDVQWQHDPTKWNQEFNECDVMVMTAQVFLDAMLHAHWSMAQVSA